MANVKMLNWWFSEVNRYYLKKGGVKQCKHIK